jgi:hypothetical protein
LSPTSAVGAVSLSRATIPSVDLAGTVGGDVDVSKSAIDSISLTATVRGRTTLSPDLS